jgi:hypothetical protein
VYRHPQPSSKVEGGCVYEDRVVLIRADTADEAIEKAEAEAATYAGDGSEFLGFTNVFHLYASSLRDKTEVYSRMRSSTLSPGDYLDHFHDSGAEHVRK